MLYRTEKQYEKMVREGRVEELYELVSNEYESVLEVKLNGKVEHLTVTKSK
jgi:hypothetical protein